MPDRLVCPDCGTVAYGSVRLTCAVAHPPRIVERLGKVFRVSTANAVDHSSWANARRWIERAVAEGDDDFAWVPDDGGEAKVYPDA